MEASSLTIFDYIVISITLLSTLFAFWKGFLRSSISFLGFILSIALAYIPFYFIQDLLKDYIDNKLLNKVLSGACSYIISLIVVGIISGKLLKLTESIRGGMLDRSLGLVFGLLRGAIICCAIFIAIVVTSKAVFTSIGDDNQNDNMVFNNLKQSKSYPLLNKGSEMLFSAVPKDMVKTLNDQFVAQLSALTQSIPNESTVLSELPKDFAVHLNPEILKTLTDNNASSQDKEKIIKSLMDNYLQTNSKASPQDIQAIEDTLRNYTKQQQNPPSNPDTQPEGAEPQQH